MPSSGSYLVLNYFCQLGIFFQSVAFYGKLGGYTTSIEVNPEDIFQTSREQGISDNK